MRGHPPLERRYATADALADDLERYLEHEPVEAGPPSKVYRFRKFARRNKGALVAGLLIAVSLIGGIVGTTWMAFEAAGERDRAVTAEELAKLLMLIPKELDGARECLLLMARGCAVLPRLLMSED